MNIVFIVPPFKAPWSGKNKWVTVPPDGYGGIQWSIKNLMDGLIELNHKITLLGAPGSKSNNLLVEVVNIGELKDIEIWIKNNYNKYDLIHDHSCRGKEFPRKLFWGKAKKLHSHYLVTPPAERENVVAVSYAHAKSIGFPQAPVIRHPINPSNYIFNENKKDYFLFLGRISPWKGPDMAALFAEKLGVKLIIAGPAWEKDYLEYILSRFKGIVEYIGEVGGKDKLTLLSEARATLVFSRSTKGPTNKMWVEPGAQVVAESAICGTPIIASNNGCLPEIVPNIGVIVKDPSILSTKQAKQIIENLPSPKNTYLFCYNQWNHKRIASQYVKLYKKVLKEEQW